MGKFIPLGKSSNIRDKRRSLVAKSELSFIVTGFTCSNLPDVPFGESDSQLLSKLLEGKENVSEIVDVLSNLTGPWSVIYWSNKSRKLLFGRDRGGRRSLLFSKQVVEDKHEILCCSVPTENSVLQDKNQNVKGCWSRVEAGNGIFEISFEGTMQLSPKCIIMSLKIPYTYHLDS